MSDITPEIVTELSPEFLREYADEVLGTIPEEKAKLDLQAASMGRMLLDEGPLAIEGVGQKLGEIPARIFFRWQNQWPDCWANKEFVTEFLRDNPQYRCPGWKPSGRDLRHAVTFTGGAPVSNLKSL